MMAVLPFCPSVFGCRRGRGPWWAALALFLAGWLSTAPARASHIVGGEMELVHRSGDGYTLLVNLYFDAVNGDPSVLSPELTGSIFERGTNQRKLNVALPLVSNTFVNYANPACARPQLSTRKLVYSRDLTLPAATYNSAQGYYAAVEQCCRNRTISNIVAPGLAAQTFYLEFPAVVRGGQPFLDSTPRIFPPLADYACLGELFYYDFGGQDADGDSLVYELATPLNGHATLNVPKPTAAPAPYAPIEWLPGGAPPLGEQNQIPGAPTLRIDRATGRLTVRPTEQGLFVFGLRCAEYRRGEKIGEARRDFQLMVRADCAANARPGLRVLPAPTGRVAYRPGRDTLRLVPGGNRCVRVHFTDPDPNSRLSLSLHPVNFTGQLPAFTGPTSGAVRSPGAPDTLTATLCFPDCLDSRGRVYLLDVVVADDGCSLPKRDTVRVAFTAVAPPNAPPAVATAAGPGRPLVVRVGDLVAFDVTGTDPDRDPVVLEMAGTGFRPADLGATLSQGPAGTQQRGRFTWRVDCRAVRPDSLLVFEFAAVTTPCGARQAVTVAVPVVVRYANRPPALTSTLPPAAAPNVPLVTLALGQQFVATFAGTDADRDDLTLTATGQAADGGEGFDLASAGMRFEAQNGPGAATGTFRWEASCAAVNLRRDLVVTFQLVDATCQPRPQTQRVRLRVQNPDSTAVRLYNVITPNGDGQNDAFRLPDLPPNFCDARFVGIKVFTRWGQQVFESADRDFRWPGQGSAGLYYYYAAYTDGRKYRGWLEVIP